MKRIKYWLLVLMLFAGLASGNMLAQDLQKPFKVNYDIYNFNIKMDSWVVTPTHTRYKLQIDVSMLPESEKLKNLPVIYVTDGQWRRMDHKYIHYLSLKFETSSVFFEAFGDRELEVNVNIPEDLAKLKYNLIFFIYSTAVNSGQWITDASKPIQFTGSGWNTFRYKWRGQVISGNIDCIRGFGVAIQRPKSAPVWKGDLYFDDIRW